MQIGWKPALCNRCRWTGEYANRYYEVFNEWPDPLTVDGLYDAEFGDRSWWTPAFTQADFDKMEAESQNVPIAPMSKEALERLWEFVRQDMPEKGVAG